MSTRIPTVRIYHNNLWARYKGAIFSEIFAQSAAAGINTEFVQIAETSRERLLLGPADRTYHKYPFKLLFSGSYNDLPLYKIIFAVIADLYRHRTHLVILPGYHRPEYWAMLVTCILLRRERAVFCDSTAYDREKGGWKEIAKSFFFRRCSAFFCYGIRSKEYVESYGVPERKIFYRCQAASLPASYSRATVDRFYESTPFGLDRPQRFVYVGRLSAEKGLYDLLEALQLLRSRLPDAALDIVGSGLVGEDLKKRALQLGLGSSAAFLGPKNADDIGTLLLNGAAMVLPSHREPWGLVVNEALSYGCPVIASSICGSVPELVLEGITGYTFTAGDVPGLAEAMFKAATMSKQRRTVAAQCLDVIEQYTPERAAAAILSGCVCILKTPQ